MSRFLSLSRHHFYKSLSGLADCARNPLYISSQQGRAVLPLYFIPQRQDQAPFPVSPDAVQTGRMLFTESFTAVGRHPETGKKQKNFKNSKKTFDRIFQSIICATETKTL